MICKYCSKEIDSSRMVCDHCGRAVATEVGNGFWDLKDNPQLKEPTPKVVEKIVEKETVRVSKIPIILCATVAVLCVVGLLVSMLSQRKMQREMERNYIVEMEEQKALFQEDLYALSLEIAELKQTLEQRDIEIKNLEGKEPSAIRIVRALGFINEPGAFLFECSPEKKPESYIWEKKINDKWQDVPFNADGINRKYGFKLQENNLCSCISAEGLTPESMGLYRCRAWYPHDNEYTIYMELVIEIADMSQAGFQEKPSSPT